MQLVVKKLIGSTREIVVRHCVVLLIAQLCITRLYAVEPESLYIELPEQEAEISLNALADRFDHSLLYSRPDLKGIILKPLKGDFTLPVALDILLKDLSLNAVVTRKRVIVVSLTPMNKQHDEGEDMSNNKTKKSLLAGIAALFVSAATQNVVGQENENNVESKGTLLEEIVVTANRRAQSIQDTVFSITALSSQTIERRGLVSMGDYLPSVPGVSMQDRGASQNSIVIRGIASDPEREDETVGVYFGETPVTGLGADSGLAGSADIKLVDIERVEVLRGPQGTLFGSGSLGGTLRVIPTAPNLAKLEGKVAASYSNTSDEGGDNTMIQGVINVPLIQDQLAIRGVAYRFDNSGYINNVAASNPNSVAGAIALGGVARDRDDIGAEDYTGFRLTALWQPIEELNITLGYTHQEIEQKGIPEVNRFLPNDYDQVRLRTGTQGNNDEFLENNLDLISLVAEYNLGWASLFSSSSWIDYETRSNTDFSHLVGLPTFFDGSGDNDAFFHELRFDSQFDGPFQLLVGFYYEDRDVEEAFPILWSGDAATEAVIAGAFNTIATTQSTFNSTEQIAVFGEISYDITEQITATFGGRYFDYEQTDAFDGFGLFFGGANTRNDKISDSGENYKVNLSYRPNDNTLIYGQWAEGFRLGQPARPIPSICDVDQDGLVDGLGIGRDALLPDELESFELGAKISLLNERLEVNGAIYRINWEGMPVSIVPPCGIQVQFNAGESKSEGMELEARAILTNNLIVNFGTSYSEATLTEDVPNVVGFGVDGDNLPGSSDFNVSAGLEYHFPIAGYDAFVRGDYSYVSEYFHNFSETGQGSGDYHRLNLKAGMKFHDIEIDVFVNNITNSNRFTWVETVLGGGGQSRAYRLRPRTVGFNIGYRF